MSELQGVGKRLKAAREAAGETQHSVSLKLEVTVGTVQAWEYERANLTLHRALQLAQLYGVTTDWIANGEESSVTEHPVLRDLRKLLNRYS